MDLPLGRIRFKAGGSAAGNRGVLSIEEALGTRAFHRLRLGIGKPPDPSRGAEYVLSPSARRSFPWWSGSSGGQGGGLVLGAGGSPPCAGRFNGLDLSLG